MRFAKNVQLNEILKVSFKSLVVTLILVVFCVDIGTYVTQIKEQGWIVNWDGRVVIYGSNYGLFFSNYFLSYSTVTNAFALLFLGLGIVHFRREGKGKVQNYPVGLFILLSQMFNLIAFFCIALPTTNNSSHLVWESVVFSKIIIPILFFAYVMIFMENKSWYGARETILRIGIRVFFIFAGVIVFYYLIWLSKDVGHANDNIFNLRRGDGDDAILWNAIDKIIGKENDTDKLRSLIDAKWNNHDVLTGDLLFHFSRWESSIASNIGEWIGVVFSGIIFFGLSFGIVPLLALLNKAVVSSPKYLVLKDENDSNRVIDLRDHTDTIDLTPIIKKRND